MEIPKDKSVTFRYSDIFFSHYFNNDIKCTHMAREHTLVYIYSGELLIEENGKETKIHKGESAFIRRNNRVVMTKQPKGNEQYSGIVMIYKRNFLRNFYQKFEKKQLLLETEKHKASVIKLPSTPDIESLFQSMKPYFNSSIEPAEELMDLKLIEGIYSLLRVDKKFYPALFDFTEPWKIDIMDFMEENYMHDLTIEDIAHFTGRSLATFKRDFKKVSDSSPQKWLIEKRLEVAHSKIRNENKKVSDVYLEVGFKNLSHFSSAFKRQFGYAPTQ